MLIDKTFFTGNLFIANLNEKCDSLQFFEWIEQWEENCLRITLGDCLYNEMITQLEWSEESQKYVLIENADAKWSQLLYGRTYTKDEVENTNYNPFNYLYVGCGCSNHNCDTLYWDGIVSILERRIPNTDIDGELQIGIKVKRSFIADYTYWAWALNDDSFTSSTGEQIANVKNAERVSNTAKRVQAYNNFVSKVIDCNSKGKVGLYRYLQDFNQSYPEWEGKCLTYEPVW